MLIFSAVDSLLGSFQSSREKRDKKIKIKIFYSQESLFFYIRFPLTISYNQITKLCNCYV